MSFDGTESFQAECIALAQHSELAAAFAGGKAVIPRGAGLTYCAASAGKDVRSVGSLRLNHILAFDGEAGIIDVEPGLRLGELYRFTAPRGWMLPVMPGHPSITVGGCIGCNVHGKNQHREGNFINAVEQLTLFHPDHGEIQCSLSKDPAVFHLTVGGFGLTGFITAVRLKLQRLPGLTVRIRRFAVSNLSQAVETMEHHAADAEVLYSWHDLNLRGLNFGRGFVYLGVSEDLPVDDNVVFHSLDANQRGSLPFNLFTRLTTRVLLGAYRWSEHCSPKDTRVSVARAVFPPNGKEFYFRWFGRRGFREYQVLIPRARWDEVNGALPVLIEKHGLPVTLGSLKLFRGSSDFLRFDGTGVVLTVDVPNRRDALAFFDDLDRLAISCGALVNLSKDGRVTAALARRLLPGYERFRQELSSFDPRRRLDSSLRRRLEV